MPLMRAQGEAALRHVVRNVMVLMDHVQDDLEAMLGGLYNRCFLSHAEPFTPITSLER
jgi:hypothetical protein